MTNAESALNTEHRFPNRLRIGIITFHWSTNYGAVLQCYALQEALSSLGHDVSVINYKLREFDDTIWHFLRYHRFLHLKRYLINHRKEAKLRQFREKYLRMTMRYSFLHELQRRCFDYDVLISGSDQVMGTYFLQYGESTGTTAYFLDFCQESTKRVAYAVSFGTTCYPQELCAKVQPLVKRFSIVSVRENTGLQIASQMGAGDSQIVPDPTLLHTSQFYDKLLGENEPQPMKIRAYMLHERVTSISRSLQELNAELIADQSIEEWLNAIKSSEHFITNSFHGMVFCLLYHIPFSIVLQTKENVGMNDRFYTLLDRLGLADRIFSEAEFCKDHLGFNHDWTDIDHRLGQFRQVGWDLLGNLASL